MTPEERLVELESRIAYLDDTVDQLNTIVSEQQRTIDKQNKLLQQLAKEHLEMKEHIAPDVVDTPPPHY